MEMEKETEGIISLFDVPMFCDDFDEIYHPLECKGRNDCGIFITDDVYSKGYKTVAAIAIEDFLVDNGKFTNDGYRDINSNRVKNYLAAEFSEVDWNKNGSQKPFDLYSVGALLAVELKAKDVKYSKKKGCFNRPKGFLLNSSVYPDRVRVRDVVSTNRLKKIPTELHHEFMDVLVVVVERYKDKVVRYSIVDGSY